MEMENDLNWDFCSNWHWWSKAVSGPGKKLKISRKRRSLARPTRINRIVALIEHD